MCKTSLLDVDTVRARTNSGGSRGGNYPLAVIFSLSRDISEPASTQAATTNINPNAAMNAMRIQTSRTPCSGCGRGRPRHIGHVPGVKARHAALLKAHELDLFSG